MSNIVVESSVCAAGTPEAHRYHYWGAVIASGYLNNG